MSGTANISDIAVSLVTGQRWAMVRTHFGINAFGVNAYVADEAGVDLVGEHDELGEGSGRHEELYFVANGHATFTVNSDEIDAPSGTFVFVRDIAAKRRAVATEAGTTIIIVGGKPGEAFTPSPWERIEISGRTVKSVWNSLACAAISGVVRNRLRFMPTKSSIGSGIGTDDRLITLKAPSMRQES